ncbi:Xaa-Pro peptidase family protein [bacterium]|nr:Xaa-Pro peptidase family protein [bacterium]
MKKKGLHQIREKMGKSGLDSLIITDTSNIRYLTGYRGDYGYILLSPSRALFFTNSLYIEDARGSVDGSFEIIEVKEDIFKTFGDFDRTVWGKRTGYEAGKITCSVFRKLGNSLPGIQFEEIKDIVEELRETKLPHEIEAIKHAQSIAEDVLEQVLTLVKDGVEERDLAIEIDYQFRKHGGERPSFETIVASGPNTSKPHAVPTARKLELGDLVLFDMGTVREGYASDMTRTVVLGKADREQKKVYSAVRDALKAALDKIHSGMLCSEADRVARTVLEKAGYGERFVHSLGHGVGLDVHENPFLSRRSEHYLQTNAVVTVEPGIYIPGWGGVRIEDMVVVSDDGCKNLTGFTKNLLQL